MRPHPMDFYSVLSGMKFDLALHSLFSENDVRGIVFDLDGTLIDSAPDIIQGMRLALEETGIGVLSDDYFPNNLHGTSDGIVRSIIDEMGWTQPDDIKAIQAAYLKHYTTLQHESTQLYAGVQDVLQSLHRAGLPMAICTNKVHASALTALQKVELDSLFSFVTGCDTWPQAKPSPVPLLETIRSLNLQPQHCLYFGDTSVDAMCAHDANVRFVLHEAGYGDHALKSQTQYFRFGHWHELLGA